MVSAGPAGIRHNGLMDADVVVIGAGALGVSTALHCAMAGRSVAVVERHTAGSQASGRAAGLFKSVQADELRTRLARRSIAKAVTFADCRPRAGPARPVGGQRVQRLRVLLLPRHRRGPGHLDHQRCPPPGMTALSPGRFGPLPDDALLTRGLWQYAHYYDPVTD